MSVEQARELVAAARARYGSDPRAAEQLALCAARLEQPLRVALAGSLKGAAGQPSYLRSSAGPGWALVGDAGYFKDPLTAHGITDALVDAEYLARAVAEGPGAALLRYSADRDRRARELFDVTDRIASFDWTIDEARRLHKRLAAAMAEEVTTLLALTNEAISA